MAGTFATTPIKAALRTMLNRSKILRYLGFVISGLSAGLLITLVSSAGVRAGGLTIWPVHINLPPTGNAQEVTVSNPSDEAIYVQVMAVEWHEAGQTNTAARVDGILAMPPVFELEPDGTQVIRVAVRKPLETNRESVYRLLVTEVPKTLGLVPNTLAIAKRMNLPVFVTPVDARPQPVWSLKKAPDGGSILHLANEGDAHIRIQNLSLIDEANQAQAFEVEEVATVLAGQTEFWPLDIDLVRLKGPVTVRAETTTGLIQTQISLPGG